MRKYIEETADINRGSKIEFMIGDYVFLSISQKVSRIESSTQANLANQMHFIRPATGEEIMKYIENNKEEQS
ncbi:hypothetical protein B425_4173 [Bacillus amyloliquefaciens]|jgi:hypothetical protein|nr:hypothetical protein B425_4173 [Bacillus amyloliquefaciens]